MNKTRLSIEHVNLFRDVLAEHFHQYPEMEIQDTVKLIYQSVFGPGHMIPDEAASLERLREEFFFTESSGTQPLAEPIANGFARLNLAAVKHAYPALSLSTINRLFFLTANQREGSRVKMRPYLDAFRAYVGTEKTPFAKDDVDNFLTGYAKRGFPALSHSERYRQLYAPSYRVVDRRFCPYLSLFESIDATIRQKGFANIAIDGNCGSGKSMLGAMLREIYSANLIAADDFFLPAELRTEERFQIPGNNIHYERFLEELFPMKDNLPFSYRTFDCSLMDYTGTVDVRPAAVTVVEGSYSMRPDFLPLYDIRVFLTVDSAEQLRRIRERNGKNALKDFKNRWIPLERAYFDAYNVKDSADFVFDTTSETHSCPG